MNEHPATTLVLIDDDPDVLAAMEQVLTQAGYSVITGGTAAEALALTRKHRPALLLLDVNLPDGNGIDVARALKTDSDLAGLFVMLVSGISISGEAQAAGLLGGLADGYLVRPLTKAEMLARVAVLLRLRASQDQLRLSEARSRAITESAGDAIVTVDPGGAIVGWNRGAALMFGYTAAEAARLEAAVLIAEPNREAFQAGLRRLMDGRAAPDIGKALELSGARKSGAIFPLELTFSRWTGTVASDWFVTAVIRDIGARKRLEAQLRQSERLNSIGQLVAGIAHEINNPIAYVYSNLASLSEYVNQLLAIIERQPQDVASVDALTAAALGAKDRETIAHIREDFPTLLAESRAGLQRVKEIVQALRRFSALDRGEPWRRADLKESIESALSAVWDQLAYKCTVHRDYGSVPPIECMYTQLNQVFMNILVNAAQAMDGHGEIWIRSGCSDAEAWVEFADNGPGMPPQDLPFIFDPFFTTRELGHGAGLGLSVAHGIVARHHGRIEVKSELGKGSVFRVCLPITQAHDPPPALMTVSQ